MNDNLFIVLIIFVAITALSFLGQAIAMFQIAKTTKDIQAKVNEFLPKAEATLKSAELTLSDSRAQMQQITTRANEVLDLTKTQLVRVDSLVEDATSRARLQIARADKMMDTTLNRVQGTVNSVQSSVLKPVREISSVAIGVRAAMSQLLKGSPSNVAQVTSDEEMFI